MSVNGPILVLNSGSSSLKLGVFTSSENDERLLLQGSAEGVGRPDGKLTFRTADGSILIDRPHTLESQAEALDHLTTATREHLSGDLVAVGHRVVHGGPRLREHQAITPDVIAELERSIHFAPLHIPDALRAIRQAQQIFPATPQVACFDTTFHRTMPAVATSLAIPRHYAELGVQRYGFHGLSCESVMHRLGPKPPSRIVIAHLGGGCSVTAVKEGASIDTTMGLSPTGGIPMATRTGDLDPAVLLFLLRSGLNVEELEGLVNHQCGLFALSGGESDMQALLAKANAGDGAATLALDVFCTAIRKAIGSFAALMGGVDLLIFTGGIGQHSVEVRSRVLGGLEFLNLCDPNPDTSRVLALGAEEEIQIARQCRSLAV